jgi:hypothetical protein
MMRLLSLLALVALAAACGGTADTRDAPEQAAAPSGELFVARLAGASGPATAYDGASLSRRFQLPPGLRAADGSALYALGNNKLRRIDPATGVTMREYRLEPGWRLQGVSANGFWVALARGRTEILVLDGRTGRRAHELALRGRFLVETISADGDFLFLQETFVDGRYAVRGYDLAAGQLLPGSLATKGETVVMQGVAAGTVASPDGRWLLTLYVDTKENTAFVHALNLVDRIPLCIEMPPCNGCTVAQLRRWALALAPDGRTLYVTNPAVGRVGEIHLPTAQLIYHARFKPGTGSGDTRAAVAPDSAHVVFTDGETVWSYDTHRGWPQTVTTGVERVADLGLSADGKRLFVARPNAAPVSVGI